MKIIVSCNLHLSETGKTPTFSFQICSYSHIKVSRAVTCTRVMNIMVNRSDLEAVDLQVGQNEMFHAVICFIDQMFRENCG